MNKILLSSLAFICPILATDVSLGTSNGQFLAEIGNCQNSTLENKGTNSISSEVFKAENKTFEQNIARTVDKNISETISRINDKLKKESGKSFWAADVKWMSSINALKELIVRAKDIYSITEEERILKYKETADLYKNAVLRNLSSDSETALSNVNSALTSWMVYTALYKRFHEEQYDSKDVQGKLSEQLFSSVIDQISGMLKTENISVGDQNFNAWELLQEKNNGEKSIVDMLSNDWSCYIHQLNIISFEEYFYESTTEKVAEYVETVEYQIPKLATEIAAERMKYTKSDDTYSTLSKGASILKDFYNNNSQFRKAFSELQNLRFKQSLPGLTQDVYDKQYLYFVRSYLILLDQVKDFKKISIDKIAPSWLHFVEEAKSDTNTKFYHEYLNRLIKNCIILNGKESNNDIVLKSIALLGDLVNTSKKYKLNLPEYKAVDLATILQKCDVKPEDFFKRIDAFEWNDPNGFVGCESYLTIQALTEIFYNRELSCKEKELIRTEYDKFLVKSGEQSDFLTLVNILIDCVYFNIDFLEVLPKLGATYYTMIYHGEFKFFNDSYDIQRSRLLRLQTLYKLCPERFDELFPKDLVIDKKAFKQFMDETCKVVDHDYSYHPYRKSEFRNRKKFTPERIFEPGSKVEKEKFVISNK